MSVNLNSHKPQVQSQTVPSPIAGKTEKQKKPGLASRVKVMFRGSAPVKQEPVRQKPLTKRQRYTQAMRESTDLTKTTLGKSASVHKAVGKWHKEKKHDIGKTQQLAHDTFLALRETRKAAVEIGAKYGLSKDQVESFLDSKDDTEISKLGSISVERLTMATLKNDYLLTKSDQRSMNQVVQRGIGEIQEELGKLAKDSTNKAVVEKLGELSVSMLDLYEITDEFRDPPMDDSYSESDTPEPRSEIEITEPQKTPQKETIEPTFEEIEASPETRIKEESPEKSKKIQDTGGIQEKITESPVEPSKKESIGEASDEPDSKLPEQVDVENEVEVKKGLNDDVLHSPVEKTPDTPLDEVKMEQESEQKPEMGDKKLQTPSHTDEKVRIGDSDYERQIEEKKKGLDIAPKTESLPVSEKQTRLNELEKQLLPLLTEYLKLTTGGGGVPRTPVVQRPPMQERKSIVKNSVRDVNTSLRNPAVSDQVKKNSPAVPKAINSMVGGMKMPNPMQAMMAMFLVSLLAKILGMDLSAFAQLGKMFAGGQGGNRN